ncbi:MAG: diguanylate cyclase [Candidatus Omnitrophica bacterium]|nr:diguanylate cyclase [Candidatus Omnitrophota bacterium]
MKIRKVLEKFSLLPQGIKYKLIIAFGLMSVIPLLVIGYLMSSFVLLGEEITLGQISIIMLLCIIISWLGLFLAKNIVERIIDIALEIKIITEGNYDRKITVDANDEIGQIGDAINFLTKKIKASITDLKDYQFKVKEINEDIQRRMLILSSLLQIGELISAFVSLDNIMDLVLKKLSQLYEGGFAVSYFTEGDGKRFKIHRSCNLQSKEALTVELEKGKGLLGKAITSKKPVIIDSSSKFASKEYQEARALYACENLVVYPIYIPQGTDVLLISGNNAKNFTFTSDDVDIIRIFAEQITIAIENDFLMRKAEKLEIKDEVTGLFNRGYIQHRLSEEIKRSVVSQRPCSLILIDLDDFKAYLKEKGQPQAEIALRKIASLITEFCLPIGRAGRVEPDTFAIIMPEINKKGAMEIAEKIIKRIEALELSADKNDKLTASAGISENPLDGSNAEQILKVAQEALDLAKSRGKNRAESTEV